MAPLSQPPAKVKERKEPQRGLPTSKNHTPSPSHELERMLFSSLIHCRVQKQPVDFFMSTFPWLQSLTGHTDFWLRTETQIKALAALSWFFIHLLSQQLFIEHLVWVKNSIGKSVCAKSDKLSPPRGLVVQCKRNTWIGTPGWLSRLSRCLRLRSWFWSSRTEPPIRLPAQQGICFFLCPYSAPLWNNYNWNLQRKERRRGREEREEGREAGRSKHTNVTFFVPHE